MHWLYVAQIALGMLSLKDFALKAGVFLILREKKTKGADVCEVGH